MPRSGMPATVKVQRNNKLLARKGANLPGLFAGVCRGLSIAALLLLLLCDQSSAASPAGGEHCSGTDVTVEGASSEQLDTICQLAASAEAYLAGCGVSSRQALKVKVVDAISHPLMTDAFGAFFPKTNVIEILSRNKQSILMTQTPLISLLDGPEFWRSAIVHEISQATAWNHAKERNTKLRAVEIEYIAYAVQLTLMTNEQRSILIEKFSDRKKIDLEELDPLVLSIAPTVFGIKAYLHFSGVEGGCPFLGAIVKGEAGLPR